MTISADAIYSSSALLKPKALDVNNRVKRRNLYDASREEMSLIKTTKLVKEESPSEHESDEHHP